MTKLRWLLAIAAMLPAPAAAIPPPPPSDRIDCRAPIYVTDSFICASPDLMATETRLAAALDRIGPERLAALPRTIERQEDWYMRRGRCSTRPGQADCVRGAYRERLAVLAGIAEPAASARPIACAGGAWAAPAAVLAIDGGAVLFDANGDVLAVAVRRSGRWRPFLRLDGDPSGRFRLRFEGQPAVACRAARAG
jgi:uncharacterized protein